MHCPYCAFVNDEDDHRCRKCGRILPGIVVEAPPSYLVDSMVAQPTLPDAPERQALAARVGSAGALPLFQASSKTVASFAQALRQASDLFDLSADSRASTVEPPKLVTTLTPADDRPRNDAGTTAGTVERLTQQNAVVRAPADDNAAPVMGRVAPIMRRVVAGAMDVSMVFVGFGVFLLTAWFAGSAFGTGRFMWLALSACFLVISLFYGLLWAMARRESAGMRWTRLRLLAFDGSIPGCRVRVVRFVAAWLSYCTGGLGLLWAFADEDNLALHDRISETFPIESR
jgi:uncharacterized RDD family membrane protein YckC